jgi:hypothetical protein
LNFFYDEWCLIICRFLPYFWFHSFLFAVQHASALRKNRTVRHLSVPHISESTVTRNN